MEQISGEICTYEEAYGFLKELEERILCMKEDYYSWGGRTPSERAENSLYALSLMTSVDGTLEKGYTKQLDLFLKEVEQRYLSDRRYLLPFILGLYVAYKHFQYKKPIVVKEVVDILLRAEKEEKRLSFGVEYLFSVAFFLDLLEFDIEENDIQKVTNQAKELAVVFSKYYDTISDDEIKVKLLYSLAALPPSRENLKHLYQKFKGDIDDLRERVKAEDIKALLIRPYMQLGVHCNRKIVFDLMKYFQENSFGLEERKLRQRLARFFLYLGNAKRTDTEIQELESDRYRISFELPKESVLSLQKQIPGIPFICKIALALCNAGFKQVYTIPGHERKEYQEFKKSKETEKYFRIQRKGLDEFLKESTDSAYKIMVAKGLALLVASIVVAVAGAVMSQPTVVVGPVLVFIISQLLAVFPQISKSGYALIDTLIKKKDHKKRIRRSLENKLG